MKSIVDLGCDIADIHHQYSAVHSSLFGASSYRLAIAAMTGRTAKTYQAYLQTLDKLQSRLSDLAAEVSTTDAGTMTHQSRQLRDALTKYCSTLHSALVSLHHICSQLLQDEESYRNIPPGGQSRFNQDKIHYDRVLLQLDKLGRMLNQLFARF
jgi:hypothetical protein